MCVCVYIYIYTHTHKQISGLPGIQYIRHTSHFIYGLTRTLSAIHLTIMHILHKIYRRYTHVDIIQQRSYRHIWEVPTHRHFQLKIEHPGNTGSLSLLYFKIQISPTGKIYISFYRKPTTKDLFVHFKSALPFSAKTNYIRNEMKLNKFTIDAAKKGQNYTHCTLYKHPQKQWLSNINHTTFK